MDLDVVDQPAPRPASGIIFLDDDPEPQHTATEQTPAEPVTYALGNPVTLVSNASPVGSGAMVTAPPTRSTMVTQATPVVIPTSSSIAFSMHCVSEEQTGAAKEAMIQAKMMMQHTKEVFEARKLAYDASSALKANIRKACEIGSQYTQMES
ncbi:uncharacterized protein LOC123446494 isoform X1 [Hordeum vulgare subsp. vulgare]|uniref:uncharacterized protein LOC123446494 isoform X1 n=1 Tax=Hordeum vulgare subsp. vulgare TaxID=112509 RepID=UPI001D1A4C88|nr:uncharacterized protein LOC123446494 isoform X1 [Hordeum vulgare subsp. vulgare]